MLPSKRIEELSLKDKFDNFYKIPPYVRKWINKNNELLPEGQYYLPWSLMRCVTLFDKDKNPIKHITYEYIEDNG